MAPVLEFGGGVPFWCRHFQVLSDLVVVSVGVQSIDQMELFIYSGLLLIYVLLIYIGQEYLNKITNFK